MAATRRAVSTATTLASVAVCCPSRADPTVSTRIAQGPVPVGQCRGVASSTRAVGNDPEPDREGSDRHGQAHRGGGVPSSGAKTDGHRQSDRRG